jgi:DNA-binding MarR family transcriptional regulator
VNRRTVSDHPKDAVFRLIVLEILYLAGALEKRGSQIANEVGLTRPQWQLLVAAEAHHGTVPQLARRMGLARQSIQRTADHLVKRGLAVYARNPDHQRSRLLNVTPRGSVVLLHLEHIAQQKRGEFMNSDRVMSEELTIAHRVLESMREHVDLR